MDIFSIFSGVSMSGRKPPAVSKDRGASRASAETRLNGLVVKVTTKAVLFFDDGSGREAFLPFSKIMDWWFTAGGGRRHLRVVDLELDDEITVVIPTWLARREKLR